MISVLAKRVKIAIGLGTAYTFLLCLASVAYGQDQQSAQWPEPPLMKFVSREERDQLLASDGPKERMRSSFELAEAHLKTAEDLTSNQQYVRAATELGCYQGLIEDALKFLKTQENRSNKVRDLCKRLELTLRAHSTRIESMRRMTPSDYAANVKALGIYLRDARAETLNFFYGETVISETLGSNKMPAGDENAKTKP